MDDKFGISGPMGGFLNPRQVENIKGVIDAESLAVLQEISDNDPDAKGLAEWVNSHPDITQEELMVQFENHDKLDIEGGGLVHWLKNQEVLGSHLKEGSAEYAERQTYIQKMKEWAIENGYDKSFGFGDRSIKFSSES